MNHPILKLGAFGSRFGFRDNPLTEDADRKHHDGVDLKAATGTQVYAPFFGKVVRIDRAGVGRGKGNGHAVWIDLDTPSLALLDVPERFADEPTDEPHGFEWLRFRLAYLHLERPFVDLAERVAPGSLVGAVGATGAVTGPHLHFQVFATIITSDRQASRRVPWIPVDPESLGWNLIDGRVRS